MRCEMDFSLVFKPRGGGKWGPHGAPTPITPGVGDWVWKNPGVGDLIRKNPGVLWGIYAIFTISWDRFLLKVRKNEIKPRKFLPAYAVDSRNST